MIITKSSGVMNSSFGKSQEPIAMYLEQQEELMSANSQIKNIFLMDTTDDFAEKYTYETSLGDFSPTGEGGQYSRSDFQEGYSKVIEPMTWKNSFAVTQEMVEDAKMGKIKSKAHGFVLSYSRTREKFAADVLTKGNATSMSYGGKSFNIACADGKALFSIDHPSITGKIGVQSNFFDAEFSYENLAKVEARMQKFTDDDGNLLNLHPDTIIIPNNPTIKRIVFETLNAGEGRPATADNDGNFVYGRWNVVVWNYLGRPTGLTAGKDWWMVMDSQFNEAYAGLVFLDRLELSVRSFIDDNTDDNVWAGRSRFTAAPNNWRAISGCIPGAGGTDISAD